MLDIMLTLKNRPISELSDEEIIKSFIKDKLRIDLPSGNKELVFFFDSQELINKGFTNKTVETSFCIPHKEFFSVRNEDLNIDYMVELDDDEQYLRVIFTVSSK